MNIAVLLLGLLTAFGPLSIDMYLPALPSIATDFSVPLSQIQLSLASFLIGIAIGQIFYGPLADILGRKRPLYAGLMIYGLASIFCATAKSSDALIVFRFLQALGACAGMVISRAVVRDLYQPHESAKVFSLLMLIMGVAPIVAPIIGGFLTLFWSWRFIFWLLALISLLTLVLIHFFLKETFTPNEDNKFSKTLTNYVHVLQDKEFTGYTLSMSFIYSGMFAYITGSSFVFIGHYGLTPAQYSWVFGLNAFGLILFSQVNARLLKYHTPQKIISKSLPASIVAGFFIFLCGYFNAPFWCTCASIFSFMACLGMFAPNASASALAYQKRFAGSASALMGTIQFSAAALVSSLVSHLHDETIKPMTFVMFGCCVIAYVLYYSLVRRRSQLIAT